MANVETRWIILGTDGWHVTIGKESDPSPEELERAEARLVAKGLAGWLAIMKGGYYTNRRPSLSMVRPLCDPQRSFSDAVDAFQAARAVTLGGLR
jgi:hypothetical protein